MKYLFLLSFLPLLTSCENIKASKDFNEKPIEEVLVKLKESNFPLETNVSFLSSLINANNKNYLAYELNILNNYKASIALKKVEIFDLASTELPIAIFDSIYINENLERPKLRSENDLKIISANQFGVLNLNIEFNDIKNIPEKIFHRLHFNINKGNGESIAYTFESTILDIPNKTKLTLGLPFNKKGKWLYEAEGHKNSRFFSNGKVIYPQRFALDWIFVNDDGKLAKNNIKQNKNWSGYGLEIVSVADGVVVDIKDNMIENEPLSEKMAVRITNKTISGNYVIIDIGNDLYALYGHLIPNSLKVKIGDKIKKGQIIGLLGNSGNSDLPHLHFHIESKSNVPMGGEGIPYHLKEFIQLKNYSQEEVSGLFHSNHVPLDSLSPVKKNNEFPIGFGLIEIK
ncbi:M23 family metallopeptidase [Aequorivita sp. Q41]|uniref:M23 family metallopeptidase n=1 Tax=Aequorivita sp. Q41 TaxID=3153300 RepID=UPI003241D351